MNFQKSLRHYLKNAFVCCFLLVVVLLGRPAAAYQFTYTSSELTNGSYTINGADHGIEGYVPPPAMFSIVFDVRENGLGYDFLSAEVISNHFASNIFTAVPATGSIRLNEDGSLAAWNFLIELTITVEGTSLDVFPERTLRVFESSYGIGTCNCESYMIDYDIYTQRHESWALAAVGNMWYGGSTSPDHWRVDAVKVPEPGIAILFLSAVGLLGAARLRNKA